MKKLLLITLLLISAGCTNKLVYNNLDWLLHWYIDDYIQFTPEQEAIFDQKLAGWLSWHKNHELPKYLDGFNSLTDDIRNKQLDFERLSHHQKVIEQHWQRLRTKIAPDLVEMAPQLSQQQVTHLFERLDRDNEKERQAIAEKNALNPEERQTKMTERYQDNLKSWIGQLSPEQQTLTTELYSQFQANDNYWLEYRQQYQAELKAVLESPNKGPQFNEKLLELITNPEQFRSGQLNQTHHHNMIAYKHFLLNVEATLNEQQRQTLVTEINTLTHDLEMLINQ